MQQRPRHAAAAGRAGRRRSAWRLAPSSRRRCSALYFGVLKGSPLLAGALPEIRDKVAGFGIDSVWKYAALGVFYSLFHSLLEEYYWRWFVFGQLRRLDAAGRRGRAVSSLGFMAHHVLVLGKFFGFANPATYLLSACIAVGGAVWAWLYHRTGSLVGPVAEPPAGRRGDFRDRLRPRAQTC